ncbi:hypothetical protein [Streptomyces sp. NPDC048309]|uniref:hypothetical protein n=1 Tax=Streptomyces sp. NPDC048309 TaxID=3154618 RepID=UPI0033C03590
MTQVSEGIQVGGGPTGGFEIGPDFFKISLGGAQQTTTVHETMAQINMEVPVRAKETGAAMRAQVVQKYSGWLWYHHINPTSPGIRIWVEYVAPAKEGTDGVVSMNFPVTSRSFPMPSAHHASARSAARGTPVSSHRERRQRGRSSVGLPTERRRCPCGR